MNFINELFGLLLTHQHELDLLPLNWKAIVYFLNHRFLLIILKAELMRSPGEMYDNKDKDKTSTTEIINSGALILSDIFSLGFTYL